MDGITQEAIYAYGSRNKVLAQIGFASYDLYLASSLWAGIRAKVLKGADCYGCGGKPNQVHHRSYSKATMLGGRMDRLVAVCEFCHTAAEFANGLKVGPGEANRYLDNLHNKRTKKPKVKKLSKSQRKAALKAAKKARDQKRSEPKVVATWIPPAFLANPNCVANTRKARLAKKKANRERHEALMAEQEKKTNAKRLATIKANDERKARIRAANPLPEFVPRQPVIHAHCTVPGCVCVAYTKVHCRSHHREWERECQRERIRRCFDPTT